MGAVSTGISKLDAALHGGYALPGITLLEGAPGSGKTPFGIAFADSSLKQGKKCIYIATNNLPREITEIARNIGYDVEKAVFLDCYSWLTGAEGENIIPLQDLNLLLESFDGLLDESDVECVVLDTLSSFFMHHEESSVLKFMQAFAAMAKAKNSCALVIVESGTCSDSMKASLRYLTDMDILLRKGVIEIRRAATFAPERSELPFEITPGGIEIVAMPRPEYFEERPKKIKRLRFFDGGAAQK